MRKINLSIDKLWDYNLYAIALFPLLPRAVESILMLLFFILSIIVFVNKKGSHIEEKVVQKVFLFSSVFVLYVVGSFYSANNKESINFITRTAPLLMFPLAIGVLAKEKINKNRLKNILKTYVISLVVALVCIHLYLYKSTINLPNWEYRKAFEKITDVHGTYFSLWISFGVLILFWNIFNLRKTKKKQIILISIVLISYLVYWQIVLSARLPFLATLLLVLSFFIYKIKNTHLRFYTLLGVIGVCIGLFFLNQKTIINKFDFSLPKGDYHLQHRTITSEHIRGGIYHCSFNLASKKLFFGYGIGDVNDTLNKCYVEEIDTNVYQILQYNTHNQYMQIMLSSGIVGLLLFVISLFVALKASYKMQYKLYLLFNVLLIICFMTENILSRHDGVLFYSFFNSIFAFYLIGKEIKE